MPAAGVSWAVHDVRCQPRAKSGVECVVRERARESVPVPFHQLILLMTSYFRGPGSISCPISVLHSQKLHSAPPSKVRDLLTKFGSPPAMAVAPFHAAIGWNSPPALTAPEVPGGGPGPPLPLVLKSAPARCPIFCRWRPSSISSCFRTNRVGPRSPFLFWFKSGPVCAPLSLFSGGVPSVGQSLVFQRLN